MTQIKEPLKEMFSRSKLLILDFSQIPSNSPVEENIKFFFEACEAHNKDPKLPVNRQKFNDALLEKSGMRYLVSRYLEDRSAMLYGSSIYKEGRTYHLGIDIFSKDKEAVYAPCDGDILYIGEESENHSFGHFLIFRPNDNILPYIFFGHLSAKSHVPGLVKSGEMIGRMGDYINHENGGWSRHLHLQLLSNLPEKGAAPKGYTSLNDLAQAKIDFPNPIKTLFPNWKIN